MPSFLTWTHLKLALRFKKYALETSFTLIPLNFGNTSSFKPKKYPIIFKFVPCKDDFNPSNPDHLSLVKKQNGLEQGTISRAHWIKNIEHLATNQSFAFLKVMCLSLEQANTLLQKCMFVLGHKITVCKNIHEPI